jgi:cation diffusion facilitator family transporter
MNSLETTEIASTGPQHDRRQALLRRGVKLEYFTVIYNVVEAAIAVTAGVIAGSLALIGFGLDSLIEIAAGGTILWRLKGELRLGQAPPAARHSFLEKRASRIIGVTFFALALYILVQAVYDLAAGSEASASPVGIALAIASLLIMPILASMKIRLARRLGSKSMESEAMETWICVYLSLILLVGLGLNAAFGWSWADPMAALAMMPLVLKEGWEAWEEGADDGDR